MSIQHFGGTTSYVTPAELMVKSDPFKSTNTFAERTPDMVYLVLRSENANYAGNGRWEFNIDWRSPLKSKKYMIVLESFANNPSYYDFGTRPITIGWNYTSPNTFDTARVPEAPIAVGVGNFIQNNLKYGASFTASAEERLGNVAIQIRNQGGFADGFTPGTFSGETGHAHFILSMYLLPVTD